MNKKKITNKINGDVVIEDIGVRLRGIGDSAIVQATLADNSKDLAYHSKFVSVISIKEPPKMPIWPFINNEEQKPSPESKTVADKSSEEQITALIKHVSSIEGLLNQLLQRPSPAPPEVLAAHIRTINSMQNVPAGLPGAPNIPGPGAESDPVFIPRKIVPDSSGGKIKTSEEEVQKDDYEDSLAALRKARSKK